MSVEIRELTKVYGEQKAVDSISFTAERGKITGFLGPNGAGKSTTMKIATGFIPPTAGTVTVGGRDIREESLEIRRRTGYLPEHNPLYLDMYVHEYLDFIGRANGLGGRSLAARKKEIVGLCGLGREQNKQIGALSKGYRQRVGLAQSLIHNPEVLILDEPTTGLDPNQLAEIRKVIKEVSKDKTVIFSTHIMQEVEALCDHVVIINRGSIVKDATLAVLQQQNAGSSTVLVEFSEKTDPAIFNELEGELTWTEVSPLEYRLQVGSQRDLRNDLLKLASDKNLPLVGLKREAASLEEMFRALTKN